MPISQKTSHCQSRQEVSITAVTILRGTDLNKLLRQT